MHSLTFNPFVTLFAILLLSTELTVLAQLETGGRNITIPSTTTQTTTAPSSTQTSLSNTTTATNNNSTTGNQTATPTTNNSTQNSTNTPTTKLTPIPDSTGAGGNVPVPSATGGKPNGRFGPDDQYIAGFPKLSIPLLSGCLVMVSTIVLLGYGSIF